MLKLGELLKKKETDSNVVIHPGIGVFSHVIKGRNKFEIMLVRSKKGMIISKDAEPIHAFIFIVASPDQNHFYMHSLMWIVQIAEQTDFGTAWVQAKHTDELRDIFLDAWKKRRHYEDE